MFIIYIFAFILIYVFTEKLLVGASARVCIEKDIVFVGFRLDVYFKCVFMCISIIKARASPHKYTYLFLEITHCIARNITLCWARARSAHLPLQVSVSIGTIVWPICHIIKYDTIIIIQFSRSARRCCCSVCAYMWECCAYSTSPGWIAINLPQLSYFSLVSVLKVYCVMRRDDGGFSRCQWSKNCRQLYHFNYFCCWNFRIFLLICLSKNSLAIENAVKMWCQLIWYEWDDRGHCFSLSRIHRAWIPLNHLRFNDSNSVIAVWHEIWNGIVLLHDILQNCRMLVGWLDDSRIIEEYHRIVRASIVQTCKVLNEYSFNFRYWTEVLSKDYLWLLLLLMLLSFIRKGEMLRFVHRLDIC